MAKSLIIELSDAQYEALRAAAEAAHTSPEQLVASTVAQHYDMNKPATSQESSREAFIQFMRARGHLRNSGEISSPPPLADMPRYGTPEWDQMVEEIGDELSDAAEAMGTDLANLSDLVER